LPLFPIADETKNVCCEMHVMAVLLQDYYSKLSKSFLWVALAQYIEAETY